MERQVWWNSIWKLLFPVKDICLFCLENSPSAEHAEICSKCVEKIVQISEDNKACSRCGYFMGENNCPNCRTWTEMSLRVSSVVPHEGMFRELIYDLKYNGRKDLAEPIGYLMACRLKKLGFIEKIRAVVPVPLYFSRQSERGYNQSLLLAKVVAEELGKPLWADALAREHFHHPQMVLSREERMKNIKGAFKYSQEKKMSGSTILLVDDIITTGATLLACADVLRQAGAAEVYGVTWAAGYNVKMMEKFAGSWFYYQKVKENKYK